MILLSFIHVISHFFWKLMKSIGGPIKTSSEDAEK